jgi:hypothetical protein
MSTTNASPIVVQSVAAHGLATGDCVENVGLADPNANGTFQIIVIDTTHFSLTGSTGTMAGGQSGNARCVSLNPTSVALPADGTDLVDATSVNVGFEQAFDPIPYLYERVGKYRLVDVYEIDNHLTQTPWVNWAGSFGSANIALLNTPQQISQGLFSSFAGYVNTPGMPASATADILDISIITDIVLTCAGHFTIPAFAMQVGIGVEFGGASFALIPASIVTLQPDTSAGGYILGTAYPGSVHLRGTISATAVSSFNVCVMGNVYNVGSGAPSANINITPSGLWRAQINQYRGNV